MADQTPASAKERESSYSSSPIAPTILYASTDIVMAHFSEDELDSIASTNAPISLGFFSLCTGIFGSFLGVLLSTDVKDAMKHATCIAITIASGILAVFFLYLSWRDSKAARKKLATLKKRFGDKR